MAIEPTVDLQAQAILSGIKSLEKLLDQPVAREALDLTKNAQTAAQHDILQRIRRSLTQYLERDGSLFYVGFLGHFSSGKSSTINSILGAWNSSNERDTGLNPTDDTITLITREENNKLLLGVIREGHVTIRSEAVENDLLKYVVLADTPGTGDPHLITEIARDFLPICDVVLFLFSAASPLDQTDIPLLTELHKRLPFVPIRFIVTRADELRSDFSQPVSDKNLDQKKSSEFFSEVLLRTNKLLQPTVYTQEHFILIDNKARYNIEKIIELIESKCDPANPSARISIHSHKLHYYLLSAKDLKIFFAKFLEDKLQELGRIVSVADQNIQRYNENVRISNSNLTKYWIDQLARVAALKDGVLAALPAPTLLPAEISLLEVAARRKAQIAIEVSKEAAYATKYGWLKIKQEISAKVRSYLRELESYNADKPFSEQSAAHYRISIPLIHLDGDYDSLIPNSISTLWSNQRQAEIGALQDAIKDLRKMMEDTERLAHSKSPLVECESEVTSAQKSLAHDLIQFFRNVELYRDGVFSHTTKESISTLGIGAQLDALELEFTESDRASFTAETLRKLFPDFDELSAKALTSITSIGHRIRPHVENIKSARISLPPFSQELFYPLIDAEKSGLLAATTEALQKDVNELGRRLELKLTAALADASTKFDAEIIRARDDRRRWYISVVVAGGALTLAGYIGYAYLTDAASQSIWGVLAWGALANLIGDGLGYLGAKLLDNFPQRASKIKENFQATFRRTVNEIIENEISAFEFAAMGDLNLNDRLVQIYRRIIAADPDGWHTLATEQIRHLRDIQTEYVKLWTEYVATVEEIAAKAASYFSDATKNLNSLNDVANRIKERAIEPSFSLLEQTKKSLDDVRRQIQAVEF